MSLARSTVLILLGCALAGCMASDAYPSLALRDVERATGTLRPVAPAPYVLPPPSSEVLGRLEQLAADADGAHRAFLAAVPQARSAVAVARGAGPGDDSWARAQVAVAGLETTRSRAMIALADVDRIFVDAALEGTDLTRVGAVRERAAAQVGEQEAAIADMLSELR